MKDKAILFGWILGLLLLVSVLWIVTQQAQAFKLLRSVNNVLISNNDLRRVSEYLHIKAGKTEALGYWYLMHNSVNKMFVFTVFQDGISIPLGAIVSPNGTVDEILPLSAHAVQIFDTMPKNILQMYINRIENAALINFASSKGASR
jgi:hypothetical protein